MINFFHKLFKPHCPDCREEAQDNKICLGCETLKTELASVRYQNEQLMKNILEMVNPRKEEREPFQEVNFKPLTTSWRAKKQALEENDRQTARAMRAVKEETYESSKSTQQLEKELLGEEKENAI